MPGLSELNTGNGAGVTALSCAPTGTCALGGSYTAGSQRHAFVASKVDGVWTDALPVPALIAMNTGGSAEVKSVSCSN